MFAQNWPFSSPCWLNVPFQCRLLMPASLLSHWPRKETLNTVPTAADGPCRKGTRLALCLSACLILLWILEGEVFMSKLPIASGLIEILTFSQFPLSVCQLFPSLLLSNALPYSFLTSLWATKFSVWLPGRFFFKDVLHVQFVAFSN